MNTSEATKHHRIVIIASWLVDVQQTWDRDRGCVGVSCCKGLLEVLSSPGAWDSQLARPTTSLSHGSRVCNLYNKVGSQHVRYRLRVTRNDRYKGSAHCCDTGAGPSSTRRRYLGREIATRQGLAMLDRITVANHKIGSDNARYVRLRLQSPTVTERTPPLRRRRRRSGMLHHAR